MSGSAREATVVGGGPVGCVLAVLLARRGWRVRVLEKRPDIRKTAIPAGRSINLVLTARGLRGLARIGLRDEVLGITVPVLGRMMHDRAGKLAFQPYGKDESERNHSISRAELNRFLLDRAEAAGATLEFDVALVKADLATGELLLVDTRSGVQRTDRARHLFGTDGGPSALRASLVAAGAAKVEVEPLPWGYKELSFPASPGGGFAMEGSALHIWPRGGHMLMGLPNRDGSFTGTLYLPCKGSGTSFETLVSAAAVREFFAREYPDAVPLIPELEATFLANPMGELFTVRTAPWHLEDKALLLGDAAHAIVPFFGQGLNAGFEDCAVFDQVLEARPDDVAGAFAETFQLRKPNADAIAGMALENFVEMRDKVGDPAFLLRKKVESRLEQAMPGLYRTRYAMVVYSKVPYAVAQEAGRAQDELLAELLRGVTDPDQVDLGVARRLIEAKLTPVLKKHGIALETAFGA